MATTQILMSNEVSSLVHSVEKHRGTTNPFKYTTGNIVIGAMARTKERWNHQNIFQYNTNIHFPVRDSGLLFTLVLHFRVSNGTGATLQLAEKFLALFIERLSIFSAGKEIYFQTPDVFIHQLSLLPQSTREMITRGQLTSGPFTMINGATKDFYYPILYGQFNHLSSIIDLTQTTDLEIVVRTSPRNEWSRNDTAGGSIVNITVDTFELIADIINVPRSLRDELVFDHNVLTYKNYEQTETLTLSNTASTITPVITIDIGSKHSGAVHIIKRIVFSVDANVPYDSGTPNATTRFRDRGRRVEILNMILRLGNDIVADVQGEYLNRFSTNHTVGNDPFSGAHTNSENAEYQHIYFYDFGLSQSNWIQLFSGGLSTELIDPMTIQLTVEQTQANIGANSRLNILVQSACVIKQVGNQLEELLVK